VSEPGSTPESLLRDADVALFSAKDAGRARWQFFDDQMHAQAVARMSLEAQMRQGLETGEFVVHYQPIVRLCDGVEVGREALVRWQHPTRGLLTAQHFIPVAEASGLIVPLGDIVLREVVDLLAGRPDLPGTTSVNVSAMQLGMPGWVESFLETLRDIDPHRLVVEVTETAVLSLGGTTAADLGRLRDLGVGIHVDDFGTGFSSISLLRELPVTGLKLDVSFTRGLARADARSIALARGLAGLAHGLDLVTIAEGVETQSQADLLVEHGWTLGQGYLYGRPAPL
jgi:EAL domain-containing protein (putative c-di-GMP-specific phosphodiesterase class I)